MRAETTSSLSTTWGIFGEDIKLQLRESFFKEQIRWEHSGDLSLPCNVGELGLLILVVSPASFTVSSQTEAL